MGIGDIGFTEVDESYIFSDKKILYKNAIVISMEMNPEIIKTVPSKQAEKEIFRTYYELNVAVNKIKDFLNDRGYRGEAGPALGGEVNYPLLAQKSGMGVVGKHGMLITPKFGPTIRLAAIYKETKVFEDGSKECIDFKKCAVPFSIDHGCTVCIKECVFFKGDYYKIKKNFVEDKHGK
jgi:epoxyqueuosine reductase QueG